MLQSHRKVGALWRESGLSWADFLPKTEDVHNFIAEQVWAVASQARFGHQCNIWTKQDAVGFLAVFDYVIT